MAENVFTLCKETIDLAQYLVATEKDLQINKQQCKLLAKKLSGTHETLDTIREILFEEACRGQFRGAKHWELVIKELYRVLKAAEALIKDCCCNNRWLKVAIRQGDKKQDFAELLYDIDWCTSVLCSSFLQPTSQETGYFDAGACEGNLGITEYYALEAAAKDDQDCLKASLKHLKGDHVCMEGCKHLNQTEQCLAAQLLGRLQAPVLPINSSEVGTSPLILWANPGELTDGIKLGEGSTVKVYETMWGGEKYAKKKSSDSSLFKQEVATLAGIDHPHIMRLVCCSQSKRDILLMELMATDLHALLHARPRPFPNLEAVDLMLQIAEGIKYLHARSTAHRNIKSLNILVRCANLPACLGEDARVYAKIGGFGLSRVTHSKTRYSAQTHYIGTRQWMAPEVFSMEDNEDLPTRLQPLKADVYSFAIVCAEILTGEEPFGGNTYGLGRRVRRGERPKLSESCPNRLAYLIKKCWDGDHLRRPDFSEICRELRYIKGLLLKDDEVQLEKLDADAFQNKAIQVQGPWGGIGGSPFFDGITTSIRGFQLKFDKPPQAPCIWYLEVQYEVNGVSFQSYHGLSNYGAKSTEISFSSEEFLEQIEGSFGFQPVYVGSDKVTGITSLTFRTNLNTYGPFGGEGDTQFKTNPGRVVGLFGRCGLSLDQLGAFIVQDET